MDVSDDPNAVGPSLDSINNKIDALFESVQRLEQSNQQLWQRFTGLSEVLVEPRVNGNDAQPGFEVPLVVSQHVEDLEKLTPHQKKSLLHCLKALDPVEKTQIQMKIPSVGVTSSDGHPGFTKHPFRPSEVTLTEQYPRRVSMYAPGREHFEDVNSLLTSSTPVEKESVTLMPLVEGPASLSEDAVSPLPTWRQGLRSVSVGTTAHSDSPINIPIQPENAQTKYTFFKNTESVSMMPRVKIPSLTMRKTQETKLNECGRGGVQSQVLKTRVYSDSDPLAPYSNAGKCSPKCLKPQLWTMDTACTSSSASSCSSLGGPCIPYGSGRSRGVGAPCGHRICHPNATGATLCGDDAASFNAQTVNAKAEVGQARSMILLVLEELVNTESSYLHILSQFLVLRDEIFAPNWRIDRQKFIRLFPAAVDDLCNLHRESYEAMKCAFDRIADAMHNSDESLSDGLLPCNQPLPRHYPNCGLIHRRSRGRLGNTSASGGCVGAGESGANCGRSGLPVTPFTILLEMIEGKRPLGCYSHPRASSPTSAAAAASLYYRNAPIWSTAPFFKLYARYLSEFSGAMQMLNRMRCGPANLRKHLKQLQSHPACEFNDITAYLLAPVQRLPRYLLLIRKMIQYTEKIGRLQTASFAKRSRPRAGLCNPVPPPKSGALMAGFPRLEALKRAEGALHGMLLELDEMIGGDVMELKMDSREVGSGVGGGGGAEGGSEEYDFKASGGSGATKNSSLYSNNCSDCVNVNNVPSADDFVPVGGEMGCRRRRSQSIVDGKRKKIRSSSGSCPSATGRGGGFWARLKRLRLAFTLHQHQQRRAFAKGGGETLKMHDSDKLIAPKTTPRDELENLTPNLSTLLRGRDIGVRQKGIRRTASSLERSNTSKVQIWRRASSARPHHRVMPSAKSVNTPSPQDGERKPKRPSDAFDEIEKRRENRRNFLGQKALPSAKVAEMREPRTFTAGDVEGPSGGGTVKSGRGESRHVDLDQHNSAGDASTTAMAGTVKAGVAKSDSDSGVHTQTEGERSRRRRLPSHQTTIPRGQPVYTTSRSRWAGGAAHTPFVTATTTTNRQSRSKWQRRQLQISKFQYRPQSLYDRRRGDNGCHMLVEEEASRSASPTLSSTSSISSSTSSETAVESASTSYSLTTVDPHLHPVKPVVVLGSEAMKAQNSKSATSSPNVTSEDGEGEEEKEEDEDEEEEVEMGVRMSHDASADLDALLSEEVDKPAVREMKALRGELSDTSSVEVVVDSRGENVDNLARSSRIVPGPVVSPCATTVDGDAGRTVESPPLCAFEMEPLVGRLCLEDLEE